MEIPRTMTADEARKAAEEWQKKQDEFPGPVLPATPAKKVKIKHNEFYYRQREKAQRQEDYMRQGTPD